MKILHILYQSTPDTAGSSIRSRDIVNSQLAIGLTPIVITSPFQAPLEKGKKEENIEGVKYYRTFSGYASDVLSEHRTSFLIQLRKVFQVFSFTVKIYKTAKKENVDILHAHAMFFCAFPTKVVSIILNKPMLYEVRSLWEERYKGTNFVLDIIFGTITFFESFAMFLSNEVVAINKTLEQELKSRFFLKKKMIHIVENAVNLDRICIKKVNRKEKVFAYIGTISPIEGLDLLILAFNRLHAEGLKNKLIFYGDGVKLSELKELAIGNDLIEFRGRFSQDQITDVYSEVDIIINPRRKSFLTDSVTPLKPLEAMGYEKLIIASNIGGMRELIENEKTGILFNPDCLQSLRIAILNVLTRRDLEKIIANALVYVKDNRSWKVNALIYKNIYTNLINE